MEPMTDVLEVAESEAPLRVMPVPRKLVVLGAPRTGSTWFFDLLASYAAGRHPETFLLDEYFQMGSLFSPFQEILRGNGVEIRHTNQGASLKVLDWVRKKGVPIPVDAGYEKPSPDFGRALRRKALTRLRWISGPRTRFLLKVQPSHLDYSPKLLPFLRECTVLSIERRCLADQILSGCLALSTGIWKLNGYGPDPEIPEGSLICERGGFDWFCSEILAARELKARLPHVRTFYYEDLLRLRFPLLVLEQMGWMDWPIWAKIQRPLSHRLPRRDPLKCFANKDEVAGWLDEFCSAQGLPRREDRGCVRPPPVLLPWEPGQERRFRFFYALQVTNPLPLPLYAGICQRELRRMGRARHRR
jgi:hypothetical protein